MHEHPAAVGVLDDRRGRTKRAGTVRYQRKGWLRGHHGHSPHPSISHEIALSIIRHSGGHRNLSNQQICSSDAWPDHRRQSHIRSPGDRIRIDSTVGAKIRVGHGVLAHDLVKISVLAA
ncbi:hypothetical protein EEB14_58070 [Rhodococcus sp. WS4]|nr:hypothetical protein EEB14_58070 [Rhodococcus sp. WS4]